MHSSSNTVSTPLGVILSCTPFQPFNWGRKGWKYIKNYLLTHGIVYALPMLFLAYPGMLGGGGTEAIARAVLSGAVFALGVAHLLGGARLPWGGVSRVLWALPVGLALIARRRIVEARANSAAPPRP